MFEDVKALVALAGPLGVAVGAGLAALAGIGSAIRTYQKYYGANALSDYWKTTVGGTISTGQERPPEIMHLFGTYDGWTPIKYLRYKFLGLAPDTGKYVGLESAWVIPFWASLAVFIGAKVAHYFGVAPGVTKAIEGISLGALIVSTIGALALPGCPNRIGDDAIQAVLASDRGQPQILKW